MLRSHIIQEKLELNELNINKEPFHECIHSQKVNEILGNKIKVHNEPTSENPFKDLNGINN
jgi:hypothetical protein